MDYISAVSPKFREDIQKLDETNDCTVIAWANCFDSTYMKAHTYLKRFGRKHRRGMTKKQIEEAFSALKSAKYVKGPYSSSNRICVSKFIKKHPRGRYYVCVRGHAFCIKDGNIYDYKAGPRRQITFAVRVYLEGEI